MLVKEYDLMITSPNPPRRDREGMSLRTAQQIARKLGVTITPLVIEGKPTDSFRVKLKVGKDPAEHIAHTPQEAAKIATIEAAREAHKLITLAKKTYVEENLLFADFEG